MNIKLYILQMIGIAFVVVGTILAAINLTSQATKIRILEDDLKNSTQEVQKLNKDIEDKDKIIEEKDKTIEELNLQIEELKKN